VASKYKKTAQILIGKSTGNGFMPGRIAPGAWVIGAVLLGATPLLRDVAHEGAHEAVQQDAPVIGVGAHDDRLHASSGTGIATAEVILAPVVRFSSGSDGDVVGHAVRFSREVLSLSRSGW